MALLTLALVIFNAVYVVLVRQQLKQQEQHIRLQAERLVVTTVLEINANRHVVEEGHQVILRESGGPNVWAIHEVGGKMDTVSKVQIAYLYIRHFNVCYQAGRQGEAVGVWKVLPELLANADDALAHDPATVKPDETSHDAANTTTANG